MNPNGPRARSPRPVAAQLELARRGGARLHFGEHVERWAASQHGVTVSTNVRTYDAEQLVLCAGAWIGESFPEGRDIFAVYRQLLYWFPIREGYGLLREMPAFVWDVGGDRGGFIHLDGFYGFPAVDGPGGGLKVASETYERATKPDGRQHPATDREIKHMYERCVGPTCRGSAASRSERSRACTRPPAAAVRDRPPSPARLGTHRVRVFGARVQALARDRRGRRAVVDRTPAQHRPQCFQLFARPALNGQSALSRLALRRPRNGPRQSGRPIPSRCQGRSAITSASSTRRARAS
jgi:glycine/D-amino acid oxidase-like deaminating enzyme